MDYSSAFVGSLQDRSAQVQEVNARGAMDLVVHQFRRLTVERHIQISLDVSDDLRSPPLPRALYVGVLMNLFTNALKATMAASHGQDEAKVALKAWNEPTRHVLEVADNGVGVPPALEKRIWDPLFTTTSSEQFNPLGSGMGLGLALVEKVVTKAKGRVSLADPPPGFRTCFRVEFPR